MIIKKIRKFSKFLFWNKWGKPRILGRIFFTSTFGNYTHSKITRFLNEDDIVLDVGARKFPYTKYQKIKALVGIDIPSESEGYLGWDKDSFGLFTLISIMFMVIVKSYHFTKVSLTKLL